MWNRKKPVEVKPQIPKKKPGLGNDPCVTNSFIFLNMKDSKAPSRANNNKKTKEYHSKEKKKIRASSVEPGSCENHVDFEHRRVLHFAGNNTIDYRPKRRAQSQIYPMTDSSTFAQPDGQPTDHHEDQHGVVTRRSASDVTSNRTSKPVIRPRSRPLGISPESMIINQAFSFLTRDTYVGDISDSQLDPLSECSDSDDADKVDIDVDEATSSNQTIDRMTVSTLDHQHVASVLDRIRNPAPAKTALLFTCEDSESGSESEGHAPRKLQIQRTVLCIALKVKICVYIQYIPDGLRKFHQLCFFFILSLKYSMYFLAISHALCRDGSWIFQWGRG